MGFKPRSRVKKHCYIKPSNFIFPDESVRVLMYIVFLIMWILRLIKSYAIVFDTPTEDFFKNGFKRSVFGNSEAKLRSVQHSQTKQGDLNGGKELQ